MNNDKTIDRNYFDRHPARKGTCSVKCDNLAQTFGREDLIPLWVADMDFFTPDFIKNAVKKFFDFDAWGYTFEIPEWRPAIVNWMKRRHNLEIKPEWIAFIPGIVKGIGLVETYMTDPGDKVIIQSPVYHPFRIVTESLGRKVVYNPLLQNEDGTFEMDFEGLESIEGARILILSNPHNPGGKIWSEDTLRRLAGICHRKGIMVISDEIHSDMALFGKHHTSFASVSPEAAEISITFGSPSKAFNLPGIVTSYAIVPNDNLRERFYSALRASELDAPAMFQLAPVVAAYTEGEEWLASMLGYVEQNILYVKEYCEKNIPGIRVIVPDASFLVWFDCKGLGLSGEELDRLFIDKAGLALNNGMMFGKEGEGYMRLNVGCSRDVLQEAMARLERAVKER